MIGIKFELPVEYNNFLSLVLRPVELDLYKWYASQDEIFYYDKITKEVRSDLLKDKVYSGSELRKVITNTEYLLYLANIQAFPVEAKKVQINTYSDFVKSECKLIFLCADSKYVDIYCKEDSVLLSMFNICINNRFSNIEFITDDNDTRTQLRL